MDFGILDNHVKAIKDAGSGKSSNDVLLKTVKLLIDNFDFSEGTLAGYDEMEMRKLFSSFGNVAQTACDFYHGSKKHLDPAALEGKIGQKLESASKEIAEVRGLMETLEKNSAELLEREDALSKLSDEYKKKAALVSELMEIKETLTPEVLEKLEQEAVELDEFIEKNQKIKDELDKKIGEYKTARKSLSDAVVRANAEKREIEENVVETINGKIETMKEICSAQSADLERFKAEIESLREQYARFADEVEKARATHSSYMLHLGEDSKINNELMKLGVSSMDGFAKEIGQLEKTVGAELERYDEILGSIIGEQEKIKETLISRSKPQATG